VATHYTVYFLTVQYSVQRLIIYLSVAQGIIACTLIVNALLLSVVYDRQSAIIHHALTLLVPHCANAPSTVWSTCRRRTAASSVRDDRVIADTLFSALQAALVGLLLESCVPDSQQSWTCESLSPWELLAAGKMRHAWWDASAVGEGARQMPVAPVIVRTIAWCTECSSALDAPTCHYY